jgi:hypothetical protein
MCTPFVIDVSANERITKGIVTGCRHGLILINYASAYASAYAWACAGAWFSVYQFLTWLPPGSDPWHSRLPLLSHWSYIFWSDLPIMQ